MKAQVKAADQARDPRGGDQVRHSRRMHHFVKPFVFVTCPTRVLLATGKVNFDKTTGVTTRDIRLAYYDFELLFRERQLRVGIGEVYVSPEADKNDRDLVL